MKLIIEISSTAHLHPDNLEAKEFSVHSFLTGLGYDGSGDNMEACLSIPEQAAQLQAIGVARLIDLDKRIRDLIDGYSSSSTPHDWRICRNSPNEQNVV